MRKLPSVDPDEPVVVVAGSPNVGKSALIGALSSGEPEVAAYPFTTKQLHLGHFLHRRRSYQMVDTPGLLDRPMDERNLIEMQAIAALENIGDILVVLIDASESSGSSLEEQLNLLDEIRSLVTERPILVVHSKSDILKEIPEDAEHLISTINGEGIDELRDIIIQMIGADNINNPLILPEKWHIEENSLEPLGTKYEIEKRREMNN